MRFSHCTAKSAYSVCMRKRTKVVPIDEEKYRLLAMDERAHRVIFGIGGQRFAIDLLSRVSLLPAATEIVQRVYRP